MTPTENQYRILRAIGSGAALVVGRKRDVTPLLRRDWVTAEMSKDGKTYVWVRITPNGLRALADAVQAYGLPDLLPPLEKHVRVCAKCGSDRYRYEARAVEKTLGAAT